MIALDFDVEMIEMGKWCPFLLCLVRGPHAHPVCPQCGAVRFGNLSCDLCNAYHGDPLMKAMAKGKAR